MNVEHPQSQALEVTDQLGGSGAIEPRITLDYIRSQINSVAYLNGANFLSHAERTDRDDKSVLGASHLTICMLTLKNGFVVIGKAAPMSKGNFDPRKGQTFAYEDAMRQLWPLFAFAELQNGPR